MNALVVAGCWAAALGSDLDGESTPDRAYTEAPGWVGPNMWFVLVQPRVAKNRMHFDLSSRGSTEATTTPSALPLDLIQVRRALADRGIHLGPSLWALTGGTPPPTDEDLALVPQPWMWTRRSRVGRQPAPGQLALF